MSAWIPREGQSILVWGGSRGLGRALIQRLTQSGASVEVLDDGADLGDLDCPRVAADPRKSGDMRKLQRELEARDKGLDGLIVVHQYLDGGHVNQTEEEDWQQALGDNLHAVLGLCQATYPALLKARGNVLLTSSVGGLFAYDGFSSVGVSHSALHGLVRYMASEWMKRGIRVNAISVGPIDDGVHSTALDLARGRSLPVDPERQPGHASVETVLDLFDFMTSPHARWLTGQILVADGGMTLGLDFDYFLEKTNWS